ncbi:hypothetical protein EVAR_78136_1 [Eumeta japonica]|uniref:Uncharacterized protein n=1 Tax=Eumeta variegata TaxID=151549 RepID=A0A4C1T1D7_EUMVA|nr:hypothetical protein EVAR_78136_1 [Eumeta japonica]
MLLYQISYALPRAWQRTCGPLEPQVSMGGDYHLLCFGSPTSCHVNYTRKKKCVCISVHTKSGYLISLRLMDKEEPRLMSRPIAIRIAESGVGPDNGNRMDIDNRIGMKIDSENG